MLRGWLLAGFAVAALTAGALYVSLRKDPLDVRVAVIGRGRVEESISNTKAGSVRSRRSVALSSDLAGTIVAIYAREGRKVKAGDPMFAVDRREPEAALKAAEKEVQASEALLEEAMARHKDAKRERARLEQLKQTEAVSEAELDAAGTQLAVAAATEKAAAARLEARRADVARAQVVVEKCDVAAPFDGIVAARYFETGETIVPGQPVLRLVDPAALYVRAEMDEVDMAALKPGLTVRVTLDPWKGKRLSGKVTRVAPVVSEAEQENRTVEVEAELSAEAAALDLLPGTSADVEVILDEAENRLRVPAQALLEGNRVLVVGADGRARSAALRIGLRNWEYAEVLEGLAEGERVIVSLESERLAAGIVVRVVGTE